MLWECRLPSQAPEIDGVCYVNDLGDGEASPGQFRRLRITEAHDYDLVGELVDEAPALSNSRPNHAFRILANA
jgi:ribosomal protein S12 methylthiotransferase